jgi:hypothetical protein
MFTHLADNAALRLTTRFRRLQLPLDVEYDDEGKQVPLRSEL